jgi:DNA-binding MarR family transcriptional regulator
VELDLGYLAQFVGMRFNELVLERAEAEGYGDLRHAHGYVFQHLIEGPRRITELAERMGVTQQAVSKSVAELVELGYLTSDVGGDRRARQIALSKRGHAAVAQVRKTRARIEARVLAKHGAEVARAKALLAAVLDELGGTEAVRSRRVREPR